jgi:hypothetical protein
MHLRPAATLLALTLTLAAATGCSEQVKGSAAADPSAAEAPATPPSASKKPSPSTPASKAADPTAPAPQGNIKIGTRKKTTGLEICGVLKAADIEAATGGKSSADGGCVHSITSPSAFITQIVTVPDVADQEGEKKTIEIGGNTAWQIGDSKQDCQVTVMLTDDPAAIASAFSVSVVATEELDACGIALKLATEGFNRIPGA